jgi:type I restriction enzyme M protein
LKALQPVFIPKASLRQLAESLAHALRQAAALIDRYDIYQHLMDYWAETMQDDAYLIAADGWKAETYRVIERDKELDV